MNYIKKLIIQTSFMILVGYALEASAEEVACPPPVDCESCGKTIANEPLPTYDNCGVNPIQNYLATSLNCLRGSWNGIYLGTGFGWGSISYDLKIPGLVILDGTTDSSLSGISSLTRRKHNHSSNYMIEYATIGYAHSSNGLFFAVEAGYYYNSATSPIYYHDPSVFVMNVPLTATTPPLDIFTTPSVVRLDIREQNHVALDMLPGLNFGSRWTLFGRIGVEYTGYTWLRRICYPQTLVQLLTVNSAIVAASVDVNNPAETANLLNNIHGNVNDRNTGNGIGARLGGGIAFAAGPHLSFTLNLLHVFGNKVTFKPNEAAINHNFPVIVNNGQVVTVSSLEGDRTTLLAENAIKPKRNEALLGILITF